MAQVYSARAQSSDVLTPDPQGAGKPAREADYYAWLLDKAAALRAEIHVSIDGNAVAEELEELSVSLEHKLESHFRILLRHLLQYRYQANKVTGSLEASIDNARDEIAELLRRSPSLISKRDELLNTAYRLARREAGADMGYRKSEWEKRLPSNCEWAVAEILSLDFWPSPHSKAAKNSR